MSNNLLNKLSDELFHSWQTGLPVDALRARYSQLTLADAYEIQRLLIQRRLSSGERIVGKKIGVTNQLVMQQLGVDQPDFGVLTDSMLINHNGLIERDRLIQPKVEGEIAFILKKDLYGPDLTAAQVLAATEGVVACMEVVDSRIKNWDISIVDTIADNASCGLFVLGEHLVDPKHLDLYTCGMVLERNGKAVATGAGAAVLEHPANAVAWLANTLFEYEEYLAADEIILSGSLSNMVDVKNHDRFSVRIGGIGVCTVEFYGEESE